MKILCKISLNIFVDETKEHRNTRMTSLYVSDLCFSRYSQTLRRFWPAWTRRPETSSCLWRPVRSVRRPSSCGPRTTNPSATAPGCPSLPRAERKLAVILQHVSAGGAQPSFGFFFGHRRKDNL